MLERLFQPCSLAVVVQVILSLVAFQPAFARQTTSPHDLDIFGVRIGMDVPTALKAVWENANNAQPGKEKPDAKKNEGKDVRVLCKLKAGNLEILFAEGKWVKEIQMQYAKVLLQDELRLLDSGGNYSNAGNGTQRDDRYSVGFTSNDKKERFWWRDEKMDAGYRIRIGFISEQLAKGGLASKEIVRKIITVVPEDKDKFNRALAKG
jgi:hypothetical protein